MQVKLIMLRKSLRCVIHKFDVHVLQSKYYVGCQIAQHAQRILYCSPRNHRLVHRYNYRDADEADDGMGDVISKYVVPGPEYIT